MEAVGGRPLTETDRMTLYDTLTKWFWDEGGGMVLGEPSRTIYLRAKENLRLPDSELWRPSVAATVRQDANSEIARSRLARRQLSLLRTAMRADLGIVGRPYGRPPSPADKEFLRLAGTRLWQPPMVGRERTKLGRRASTSAETLVILIATASRSCGSDEPIGGHPGRRCG